MFHIDKRIAASGAALALAAGIAAPASARDRDDGYRHHDRGYSHRIANRCAVAAERTAMRYGRGMRANVTDIRDVRRTRRGYVVRGRIAVHHRWARYDRWSYRNHYRTRGFDRGSFKCRVAYGRVVDVDFHGIRGL
ncbi:hypothetical protein RXV95_06125 [Novosphingobium sp. ZN18A2]|uniref:hypothetical protein n=1 Tax=Novosphingobium sp. ZN18A2 TaxID=3079861 RepID=UPI0030D151BC